MKTWEIDTLRKILKKIDIFLKNDNFINIILKQEHDLTINNFIARGKLLTNDQ